MKRPLVAALLLVAAISGSIAVQSAATTTTEPPENCRTGPLDAPATATAALDTGDVVTLTYDFSDVEPNVTLTLRGANYVVEATNLERVRAAERIRYRWTGNGSTASISYDATSASSDDFSNGIFLTPTHQGANVSITAEDGLASRRLMYLGGAYDLRETSHGCETVRLVTACGVVVDAGRGEVLESLGSAQQQLEVGNRWATTTVYPAENIGFPAQGFSVGEGDVVVRDDSTLNGPENTYLHEYTHVRQRFADRGRIARNASWFVEASAEYTAARLSVEQGRATPAEYRTHLGYVATDNDAVLSRNETWSPLTPYEKGSAVLAELDRRLRAANDSARMETVFRAANRETKQDGVLTHADLKEIVARQGNQSVAAWFDEAVTTDRPARPQLRSGPLGMDRKATDGGSWMPDLAELLAGVWRDLAGLISPPGECGRVGRLI